MQPGRPGTAGMHRRDFLLAATSVGTLGAVRGADAALVEAGGTIASLATVHDLRRLTPRPDAIVLVRGHGAAGDGGGGLFAWDAEAGDADDGGLTFRPPTRSGGAEKGCWRRIIDGTVVNARWFGARGDGVADDAPALQAAIDYCQTGALKVLFLPAGTYRLVGRRGPDRLGSGLIVRHHPPILNPGSGVRIIGAGRATRLLAGADRMAIVRCAGDGNLLSAIALDGAGRPGVWGLAVVPEDMEQTTTVVSQQYNSFEQMLISGCAEAIVQQPGPSVNNDASGAFYNCYTDIHVYGCTRGIWLKAGASNDNGNNRNLFSNIVCTNHCNTGVHIAAGDTNTFLACHFEGVDAGTAPSLPATAVRIATGNGSFENNSNTFVSCKFEACARDVDNANRYTEFYGCAYNIGGGKVNFAALPMVNLGGYDPSNLPMIYAGLVLQHNEIAQGFPVGCISLDNRMISGVFDKDGKIQTYAIAVADTENVGDIVDVHSEYWKLNGVVEWHLRLAFAGTGRPGGIKIALPVAPSLGLHRKRASTPPSRYPVAAASGLPRPDGSEAMVLARFSDESQSLAGRPFFAIPPPPGADAFSSSPHNHISFCIRYRV